MGLTSIGGLIIERCLEKERTGSAIKLAQQNYLISHPKRKKWLAFISKKPKVLRRYFMQLVS